MMVDWSLLNGWLMVDYMRIQAPTMGGFWPFWPVEIGVLTGWTGGSKDIVQVDGWLMASFREINLPGWLWSVKTSKESYEPIMARQMDRWMYPRKHFLSKLAVEHLHSEELISSNGGFSVSVSTF